VIEQQVIDDAERFDVREVAYDPYQAVHMAQRLDAKEIETVEVANSVRNMNEAMRQMEGSIAAGEFFHANDPVLSWMAANVVCFTDQKNNIFPRKAGGKNSENKIDGIVATLFAVARIVALEHDQDSVYNDHGLDFL
jgi:phage terminase large subunit-like protein